MLIALPALAPMPGGGTMLKVLPALGGGGMPKEFDGLIGGGAMLNAE